MEPNYEYLAVVTRVVDGDTLDVTIDLGFRVFSKQRIRLYGIDTPEIYGVKEGSEEYKKGAFAKAAAIEWLDEYADVSDGDKTGVWTVILNTYDGKPLGQGKYGRWLATVWPADRGTRESLNEYLVGEGHAERKDY